MMLKGVPVYWEHQNGPRQTVKAFRGSCFHFGNDSILRDLMAFFIEFPRYIGLANLLFAKNLSFLQDINL